MNQRDDLVPVHPGQVPYEWFAHLYSLVSRSFQCPIFCHGVCARRSRPPFLAVIALVAALFDPALSMAIGSKTGLSLLASEAIVYVIPRTRACRPDRPSKTIFPEDVSENMTWMCLANPRIFCCVERLSSRLPTLLCRVDRGEPLMSNLFVLPLCTIEGEPKYVGAKSQ